MNENDKKLNKLEAILKLVDESVTKEEFVQSFEMVIKIVKDLQRENETEFLLIHQSLNLMSDKLKTANSEDVKDAKDKMLATLSSALKEQENGMNYLRDWVRNLPVAQNGKDGLDGAQGVEGQPGKDGTLLSGNEIISKINEAETQIIPEAISGLKDLVEEMKNGVKVGAKVGWGAHPLVIAKSGTVKAKVARHINFTGSGVSSVTQNPNGTIDVTISGGSGGGGGTLTSETPVGTVDGVNKTFTVSNIPVQLFLNQGLQILNDDYTVSGLTITFVNAPIASSTTPLISWYFSSVAQGTPKGEAPTGTINSVNTTFTLSQTPSPASFLQLYLGRQLQIQGVDYTLSTATITYTTAPDISLVGQHYAYYLY